MTRRAPRLRGPAIFRPPPGWRGPPWPRLWEIVLAGEGVGRVVVILVTGAVPLLLHQSGRRVEDVFRRRQRAALLGHALGCAERGVGGVGLGRRRHLNQRP